MPGSLTVERAFPEIEELSDDAYWRSVERVVAVLTEEAARPGGIEFLADVAAQHPEWPVQWADALWQRGLASDLITPLPSIGMRAWRLSGDLLAWSALVGEGVREGWLPWKESEPQ